MSKKNSSVILKNQFRDFKDLSKVYSNFQKKIEKLNSKSFLVAVSGGPDSLALAALTKAFYYKKNKKFFYVLINHKIRSNSSQEAIKVKNLVFKLGIKLKIIKNESKIKKNIQGEARNIRYNLLLDFCKKYKIKTILTAHNLEDQVETFLIRLSRGSGLTGLSSMKPLVRLNKTVKLSRPLLDFNKSTLKIISKKIFGKYFKDPSNKDQKYLRSRIRNLKNPLEKSGIEYNQIIKSINNLNSSKIILDDYYAQIIEKLVKKENKKISINLKKFNILKDEIKMRVINDSIKHIKKNYYSIRSKKIIRLIQHIQYKNFSQTTLGGCIFYKNDGLLCLKEEKN